MHRKREELIFFPFLSSLPPPQKTILKKKVTDNRLQLWIARSCIDHNTKLYQFYPRDCAVNLNLWESPLWVRGGLSLLFGICDISRNCSTNKTILGLSSVWGTGLKSATSKGNKFHSTFKFFHFSISYSFLSSSL